jgi:hypothetical protein
MQARLSSTHGGVRRQAADLSLTDNAALSARQNQTTTASFTGFFEVGVGLPLWKSRPKRGPSSGPHAADTGE